MQTSPLIRTAADLMAKWPTDADFARDIGITPSHGQVMKLRNSIPSAYWPPVIAAARTRKIRGVTMQKLMEIAPKRASQARKLDRAGAHA